MAARLKSIRIQNYRSLADVSLELKPINVLFGPSGAGKSSLLEAIQLVHDCAERGADFASSRQGQGLGLLFDGAAPGELIRIELATEAAEYEVSVGTSAGRIDPLPGERLSSILPDRSITLFERQPGKVLPELADRRDDSAGELIEILSTARLYHSRSFGLRKLKWLGSTTGVESHLSEGGENLWSILRDLEGRRQGDDRYATILRYMSEAFPTFEGLVIEATSPTALHASFLEHGRNAPVPDSGISDGHLQFLILLTALFYEEARKPRLVLFDEPELSLHPWSLTLLARAIREATQCWGRQVILATQSPALLNEFDLDEQLAVESREGRTRITPVGEFEDIRDLLEDYTTGTLYMTGNVAPQNRLVELSTLDR